MIYYIADTHFGHENILHYDSRPFKNIGTMDDALVFNWNNSVRPEDTVYVLGDAFWGNEERCVQIMKMLNGHKHLYIKLFYFLQKPLGEHFTIRRNNR